MSNIQSVTASAVQHTQNFYQGIENHAMHESSKKVSSVFVGALLILGAILIAGPLTGLIVAAVVASAAASLCYNVHGRVYIPNDQVYGEPRFRFIPARFQRVPGPPPAVRPSVYQPASPRRGPVAGLRNEIRFPVGGGGRWWN